MDLTVEVVDRMNGSRSVKSQRWYEAVKKSSRNKLPNGTPRYVLADGATYTPAVTAEKKSPGVKKAAVNEVYKKNVLTETMELSDETIENFIKASGKVEHIERLRTKLGDRAEKWKEKIDARVSEITAGEKETPAQPAPQPEKPAPKPIGKTKTANTKTAAK